MPAADEQRDGRVFEGSGVRVEDVGGDVPHEVVDGVEGLAERDGEALRRADPDHERPGEPRTGCHRDGVELVEAHIRLGERRLDRRLKRLEVGTGGDLGDDPAIAGVLVHAARDGVRQQGAPADDPDPRLVAARLDAEDEGFAAVHATPPSAAGAAATRNRITIASTPSPG